MQQECNEKRLTAEFLVRCDKCTQGARNGAEYAIQVWKKCNEFIWLMDAQAEATRATH